MSSTEIFTAAVKRGDLESVRSAIDEMEARAEVSNDDSEMRAFLHVAGAVRFGEGE